MLVPKDLRLKLKDGEREPRLWVRRLVVWSAPGIVVRDVQLRPGLNIVWSPDPADLGPAEESPSGGLGHGSGKTLFCRLIRYCLGEDRFAPDGQRDRIVLAFKDGLVGAEVILDGRPWAIIRPLGLSDRNTAKPDVTLDQLVAADEKPDGIAGFLKALESQVITEEVAVLVPGERAHVAWLAALAWLARDQECRIGGALEWRSKASDSGSPVRGWSAERTLDALRALVGASSPEEFAIRGEIRQLEQERDQAGSDRSSLSWAADRERSALAATLGLRLESLPADELAVELFRKAARERLAKVVQVGSAAETRDLAELRATRDAAEERARTAAEKAARNQATIPELRKLVAQMRGEIPGFTFRVHSAENPHCPICEVPLASALVEGCKLSNKLPDLAVVRKRFEDLHRELAEEERRLQDAERQERQLSKEAVLVQEAVDDLDKQILVAERVADERGEAWYAARRLADEAGRLSVTLSERDKLAAKGERLLAKIERKRELATVHRDKGAVVFARIGELFEAIVRALVGPTASGRLSLDGNGLHLRIDLGGERSTPAIDSLKVLAFDLAALCASMEGATHVPAFLIHDSPREADLGLSAYHPLFRLAHALEGETPRFQYIVTTTTRPPTELCKKPWLCLEISGAPAERRLLMRDL